ncbi:hypothetical protein [Pleurocapsa sp. FMAR1]|uniref:hypothetical protein n=1 Tax=Pleurocapsa sp. FMAR1 TaxID=3040204 RepID=UPI0029C91A2F|nr:hypothetical protein [Pleurocapsa sp. FMAR1]
MSEILNKLSISAMNNCIQAVLNVEVAIACGKKLMKPFPFANKSQLNPSTFSRPKRRSSSLSPSQRQNQRLARLHRYSFLAILPQLHTFHWELEFPEVFLRNDKSETMKKVETVHPSSLIIHPYNVASMKQ